MDTVEKDIERVLISQVEIEKTCRRSGRRSRLIMQARSLYLWVC